MKKGVYAGSFDPMTMGHQNIIERALKIVDRLIIVVMNNSKKKYWFNLKKREEMVKKIFENNDKIEVKSFDGALVDFMEKENINILIKGLRNISDFESEIILAHANYNFSEGKVETIFLPADINYSYVSSSFVKEVAIYKLNLENFVHSKIIEDVKEKAIQYR